MAAGWASRDTEFSFSPVRADPISHKDYGHVWLVDSAIEAKLKDDAHLIGSVEFVQEKTPLASLTARTQSTDNRISIGLGAESRLGVDSVTGMMGVRWSYRTHKLRDRVPATSNNSFSTHAWDTFSWGLAYSWRHLSLTGHLDTRLKIEDLFYSIDVELEI